MRSSGYPIACDHENIRLTHHGLKRPRVAVVDPCRLLRHLGQVIEGIFVFGPSPRKTRQAHFFENLIWDASVEMTIDQEAVKGEGVLWCRRRVLGVLFTARSRAVLDRRDNTTAFYFYFGRNYMN